MSRALAPADPSFAKFAFRSDFFRSLFSPGENGGADEEASSKIP
jgi:hypothetical protein